MALYAFKVIASLILAGAAAARPQAQDANQSPLVDIGQTLKCADDELPVLTKSDNLRELGCLSLLPLGECTCKDNLFRREQDSACVHLWECPRCMHLLEKRSPVLYGMTEPGCRDGEAIEIPINPGDCICAYGTRRSDVGRDCVPRCIPSAKNTEGMSARDALAEAGFVVINDRPIPFTK